MLLQHRRARQTPIPDKLITQVHHPDTTPNTIELTPQLPGNIPTCCTAFLVCKHSMPRAGIPTSSQINATTESPECIPCETHVRAWNAKPTGMAISIAIAKSSAAIGSTLPAALCLSLCLCVCPSPYPTAAPFPLLFPHFFPGVTSLSPPFVLRMRSLTKKCHCNIQMKERFDMWRYITNSSARKNT